jgi:hypothetical protein
MWSVRSWSRGGGGGKRHRSWLSAPRLCLLCADGSTSSYWLNLVELWFGELTNRKLRRSTHRSVTELETDADTWIQAWNNDPKRVTKTADEVLDSLANCCKQLNALTNNSVH